MYMYVHNCIALLNLNLCRGPVSYICKKKNTCFFVCVHGVEDMCSVSKYMPFNLLH